MFYIKQNLLYHYIMYDYVNTIQQLLGEEKCKIARKIS